MELSHKQIHTIKLLALLLEYGDVDVIDNEVVVRSVCGEEKTYPATRFMEIIGL
tara:strand:- start:17643 stop:17804 length:162 start_codon:yes stop_codon:yes gene_type:complete